jgi:hypothetical protein
VVEAIGVTASTRALLMLEAAGVPFRVHRYDPKLVRDGRSAADALEVDPAC